MAGPTAKLPYPARGYIGRKGCISLSHRIQVGAAGAITAQDNDTGITAAKQGAAGTYLLTMPNGFKRIVELDCAFVGAMGAVTTGCTFDWETDNITIIGIPGGAAVGTKAGNILLVFRRSDTNAVADVPSGTVLIPQITVEVGV